MIYIYIYIYINGEREREIYIYIYMNIYSKGGNIATSWLAPPPTAPRFINSTLSMSPRATNLGPTLIFIQTRH